MNRDLKELSKYTSKDDLPIFCQWMEFLEWLLPALERFPKRVRFTLSSRIENLALDMVEYLVEARYSTDRKPALAKANICLEKIRVLLRIGFEAKYLPHNSYEHAMRKLLEVGKMLGGWIKQQDGK